MRSPEPRTVMIVDDEPAIRIGIRNAVDWAALGCRVVAVCPDADSAVKACAGAWPDIIVTDIMMPGMSGLDFIAKVRQERSDTRFIILSGYDEFAFAKRAISLDVEDFLLKPLSRAELVAAVLKAVRKLDSMPGGAGRPFPGDKFLSSAKTLLLQRLARGEFKDRAAFERELDGIELASAGGQVTVMVFQSLRGNPPASMARGFSAAAEAVGADVWDQDDRTTLALVGGLRANASHLAKGLLEKELADCPWTALGIGDTVSDIMDAPRSYQRALLALSYRMYGGGRVFSSDSLDKFPDTPLSYDIDTRKVIDILYRGDDRQLMAYVDEFFASLFASSPTPPPSYVRGMCIYLVEDTVKAMLRDEHLSPGVAPRIDGAEVNKLESLREIRSWVEERLLDLKNTVLPLSRASNDPIIFQAKKLVEDNINLNITAQEIAAKLNINFSYFSTYFKAKTGQNFRDWLNNKKNEEAKRLLRDELLSIEDVARALGYTDHRSFWRSFKNANGVSPTEWRNGTEGGK